MANERSPLLDRQNGLDDFTRDPYEQFCVLLGIPDSGNSKAKSDYGDPNKLYGRAKRRLASQSCTHTATATLSNTLLLAQVVLGATLTALGASESSHVLITIFGVMNTVIAGLVAWLKSRGQPMRARMFRDDLERVMDEMENSKVMWKGIARNMHGYDEIDVEDKVSVRSEVARLTRLYDHAVKNSTQNNPDLYMAGSLMDAVTGLRTRPAAGPMLGASILPAAAATIPAAASNAAPPTSSSATAAPVGSEVDEESPATAKPKSKGEGQQVGTIGETKHSKDESGKPTLETVQGNALSGSEPSGSAADVVGPSQSSDGGSNRSTAG